MLVPSIVAVALWFVASGYLVFQGFYNRAVASSVRQVSIPAVSSLASIQQERRLSIAYLANPSNDVTQLLDQRRQTDRGLVELRAVAPAALARAPESIQTRWKTLTDYLDQLPSTRSTIDSRSTSGQQAYDFYNKLLDASTALFDTQARVVPDVTATQGGIAAVEVFRASDLMSRAGSMIDGAFASGSLTPQEHLEFARLVGSYHAGLGNISPHLRPGIGQRFTSVQASDVWKNLVAAEDAIIGGGAWRAGVPRGLPVDRVGWEALTRQVSDELIKLTIGQADEVSAEALRTGNNQLLTASLGSLVALSVAIGAIVWAIRQSRVLVDQALSVRLARLGQDAAAVVDQRLPAMMERLRRRERVDLAVELPIHDYGSDEIGQVAEVINRSLQAAAGAAVQEAKARAAGTAMLMGVARRPQRPLQHGLKVVEDLQGQVGDEELLTQLFDINHQLTQTRRFLENLVILAGGQIGRRFQKPVPLRRVLLAAFAEARHYQRIQLRSAADVALMGQSVAGTIHLLSELLDNALAFSSPETTVWVTCFEVKHGVAVEIEDAGVGMNSEAIERANRLLATAPTPDVTELKDGAQVGLHVVAELAKRENVQVSLRKSAYGGLLAIVLLPSRMLVTDQSDTDIERADAGRHVPALASAFTSLPDDVRRHELHATGAGGAAANGSALGLLNTQAGGHRRSDTVGSNLSDRQPGSSAGIPRQAEPPVTHAVDAALAGPHAGARPPLPQRQPQQHLAPELREDGSTDTGTQGSAMPARSPEEARNRFARYQRGWTEGRAVSHNETVTGADQGRKA
ncbi:sensor histidine kinase [Allorhizocola rhizosphaerae]|uniref:sensor histidine kinase n=1 Tax=Allorhizocola rhizosphaerae TaxID=1872709 RepID=UPI002482CA35|nr:nitrate- and nitrite sensing domain-containing protein [Allorhizocola rhizosphaerae]